MGPKLERTKVDELAVMFVRDYRINAGRVWWMQRLAGLGI